MQVYISALVREMDQTGRMIRVRIKMWHGVVFEGEVPDSESLFFTQESFDLVPNRQAGLCISEQLRGARQSHEKPG